MQNTATDPAGALLLRHVRCLLVSTVVEGLTILQMDKASSVRGAGHGKIRRHWSPCSFSDAFSLNVRTVILFASDCLPYNMSWRRNTLFYPSAELMGAVLRELIRGGMINLPPGQKSGRERVSPGYATASTCWPHKCSQY